MIAAYAYGHLLALLMWGQAIDLSHIRPENCARSAITGKLEGDCAPKPQSIADNPSAPGECYTNVVAGSSNGTVKGNGTLVVTATTFAECEAKHGMWHRSPLPPPPEPHPHCPVAAFVWPLGHPEERQAVELCMEE